jgi:Glycosyl hydrolases family 38 N-terminal domain/Glycosyl hydrolases family 38 C-terminal domain/Glycosyl hydrolases family 38 C-terminal beta sandwich domain
LIRFTASTLLVLIFAAIGLAQTKDAGFADARRHHQIQTIYVMPSSHWDLGFIAPPEEVLPRLKPHIDEVIANAKRDPDFRWTIESVWQIREWLARTDDPQQIKDFVDLVHKGQIQISAVFGSMHTEFMGAEQLNRITYDMKDLEKRLGIKTDFAMMDDVPGFTLRLPQILARSGVHYFVNGSNLFLAGGTSLSPGQVPFYWQSPDGSRVLTWQTQSRFGGYTEAFADYYIDPVAREPYTKEHFYPKEWEGLPKLEIMQRGVDKLLDKYTKAGYPYDAVLLLYLHDFVSSNQEETQLLPAIREWNGAGKQPRIVVSTPAEFFHHMEEQYGSASSSDKFPSYMGDWSGLWSEVKLNSPVISAQARWLQDHAPVAELLWSLLTFRNFTSMPTGNLEDARIKLFKYDEHSGAAQVGWPKLMSRAEIDQQNREYAGYTSTGVEDIRTVIDSGVRTLFSQVPTGKRTVVVFNPVSWKRTGVARLHLKEDIALRDAVTGKVVLTQRASPDEIEFVATDIPALGHKSYLLEPAHPGRATPAKVSAATTTGPGSTDIENSFYRIRVRASDGSVASIYDKQLQRELVDTAGDKAANQLLRWTAWSNLPVGLAQVAVHIETGPVFDRVVIQRPGSLWPETQITLYRAMKCVEFANLLDRERMPFIASNQPGEYYSFNLPLRFQGSAQVWAEDGTGYHRIPEDYLPGARTDAVVPQHSLAIVGQSEGRTLRVTLSEREPFFNHLPGLPSAKGANTFLNAVRITVIRKQDQGNTRDLGMVNFSTVEPGLPAQSWYHFALSSAAGDLNPVESYQEGTSFGVPLIATELAGGMAPAQPQGSYFLLSSKNVALLAFKPSTDGNPEHYTVRLQEIGGEKAVTELNTPLKITAVEQTNLTENEGLGPVPVDPLRVTLSPHETMTLRLTIPHPHKERSERWWEWN